MSLATSSVQPATRQPSFPRLPLYSAIALVALVCTIAVFGRLTDVGTVRVATTTPVDIRDIVFLPGEGDSVIVTDAASGAVIEELGSNQDGFVRGALRGLQRSRTIANVPQTQPFRLIMWEGGAITLSDTGTGERIYLDAFGPDNVAAFSRFLAMQGENDQ